MEELLKKQMSNLTVDEYIKVKLFIHNTVKCVKPVKKSKKIDKLISDNYDSAPFNVPITKFSDIYLNLLSKCDGLNKKELALTLRTMGFIHKIKANGKGSTAHFYSVKLKEPVNGQ